MDGYDHAVSQNHECTHDEISQPVSRRYLLATTGGVALSLAGCLNQSQKAGPDPITLTTADACEICGMIIPNHPGPSAEIFYANQKPSNHDNPARFDSTWEAFQYDFERADRGWERTAFYVTDYSSVDYRVFTDRGKQLISTHPEAEAFVSASEVTFVAGSEVLGAMGNDLIAFSKRSDAEAFQSEYGGKLVKFDEVTPALIDQLGM